MLWLILLKTPNQQFNKSGISKETEQHVSHNSSWQVKKNQIGARILKRQEYSLLFSKPLLIVAECWVQKTVELAQRVVRLVLAVSSTELIRWFVVSYCSWHYCVSHLALQSTQSLSALSLDFFFPSFINIRTFITMGHLSLCNTKEKTTKPSAGVF